MISIQENAKAVTDPNDLKRRIQKLGSSVCIDKVKDRLKQGHLWTEEEAEATKEDFIRFAALTFLSDKELVPTKKIDEFWHTFLIFTRMYKEWCEMNWGSGWFLHHTPGHTGDASWEFTRDLAKDVYGVEWIDSAMAASCGCAIPPPDPAGQMFK
jgi:hypothetical protein